MAVAGSRLTLLGAHPLAFLHPGSGITVLDSISHPHREGSNCDSKTVGYFTLITDPCRRPHTLLKSPFSSGWYSIVERRSTSTQSSSRRHPATTNLLELLASCIMTRAQQTISIGLLVSSVSCNLISDQPTFPGLTVFLQLYLACFLQLIPFNAKIQEELIPVVSRLLCARIGLAVLTRRFRSHFGLSYLSGPFSYSSWGWESSLLTTSPSRIRA